MGKFIVLTGLDGCGTTTVAEQLHLEDETSTLMKSPPYPFSTNRNSIDEKVFNASPEAHYLYYLAANVYLSKLIDEKLAESDGNIYCQRFFIDTVVSHRAKGVPVDFAYETAQYAIRKPDYIFFLHVAEEERQLRLNERGRGFLDEQLSDESLRTRMQEEFDALDAHFIRIETTNRSLEEIVQEIQSYVK